jgi:hypothetical protein
MKSNYVNKIPINDINPGNYEHYIPALQMYLGIKVLKLVGKSNIISNKSMLNDFYFRAQHFLKISCLQIKKNIYNLNDPLMSKLKLINPKKAISKTRENMKIFSLLNVKPRLTKLNNT